jgi:RNase P/RNase MRP subunit p30
MGKQKSKRPRGSRGQCRHPKCLSEDGNGGGCDLFVAMPKTNSKIKSQLIIQEIKKRLVVTGFTHMALTHTIFGRPRPLEDAPDKAIDEAFLYAVQKKQNDNQEPDRKKQKVESISSQDSQIRVYRRLHAVLEGISEVGAFGANSQSADLLNGYDLISVSPRNEATFQSACSSATSVDIITLDYTGGRGALKLPFRIRSADIKSATERNVAFEIPIAPALLSPKQRKALVQTCREFQNASLGVKARLIFSSGDRMLEESDSGAMAFRSPGDLSNLINTVLGFNPLIAQQAIRATALEVLSFARQRRFGESTIADVHFDDGTKKDRKTKVDNKVKESTNNRQSPPQSPVEEQKGSENDTDEDEDDGFIAM